MADQDVNSLFDQLIEFAWKGVSVPTSKFTFRLRHDLAQHKYPGRDGADIESTGRSPYQITASIPFLNNIVPGKSEKWGILYPTQYRQFISVSAVGTTGVLQHPEFDQIACRLESCETVWAADRRDGVMVECSWLETLENNDAMTTAMSPSPVSAVLLGALDLDAHLGAVKPPFPKTPVYTPDFAATMRSITAVTDQVSLLSKRAAGRVAAIQYRLDTMQNSITTAQTDVATTVKGILNPDNGATKRALLWPINNTIEQMRGAANDLQKVLVVKNKTIRTYLTQVPMTLASVAQQVGADVNDVIALNPDACATPTVEAMTKIRYYAK